MRGKSFSPSIKTLQDDVLIDIINQVGLDGEEIVKQSKLPEADTALHEDFQLVRQLGVRGFPTIIMMNEEQKGVRIVGARTLEDYANTLQRLLPDETITPKQLSGLDQLLKEEKLLFSREIEEFYSIDRTEVEAFTQQQLLQDAYTVTSLLGEKYIQAK